MADTTNGALPTGNGGVNNPLLQQNPDATATATGATPAPVSAPTTSTGATGATFGATGTTNAATGMGSPATPSSAANWYNPDAVKQQMAKNSQAWANTTDQATKDSLHQQNMQLAQIAGGTWNPNTNAYDFKTPLPSGYQPPANAPAAWHSQDGSIVASDYNTPNTLNGQNGQQLQTQVYKGHSYGSAQDIANIFGGTYKQDSTTGAVTINGQQVQPIGYDKNGQPVVSVRNALAAMGYNQNDIKYDANTKQITVNGKTPPTQQEQSMLAQILGSQPQMPQLSPYQGFDPSPYYKNLEPMQQFNSDWNSYYNQAGNQINPLTNNSINTLLNKQGMDLNKADEGLNAKGIFNSGIAVAMENQIRANVNDQVAKVVMNANSQISKTAQTLYSDALKQWNDGNTQALKNNQMWLTQSMNEQKQQFSQWLGTQKLSLDQYNYALKAWDDSANLAMKDAQMQIQNNQFHQTMDMKNYQFNNLSADQQMNGNLNYAKTFGYDSNGHPTIDTWKALGYMPGPDGKLTPTLQATMDQKNYALNMAKAFGYGVGPDGKIDPTLDANKLTAQVKQWTAQNKMEAQKIGVSKDQLAQKTWYDKQMIEKAQAAQTDTNKRTQLEGLKSQLDSVSKLIAAKQALLSTGQSLPSDDKDIAKYNEIMNSVNAIINPSIGGTGMSGDQVTDPWQEGSGPLTHDQLTSVAHQATQIAGVDASWVGPLAQLATQESGGDPAQVNSQGVYYSDQYGNQHATGLMQMMPPTFNEYKVAGHGDINNPLDNMLASINYIKANYGTAQNALDGWAERGGY